jgi:hypothetical protein
MSIDFWGLPNTINSMLEEDSDPLSQDGARWTCCRSYGARSKTVRVDAANQLYSFFVA